LRAFTAVAETGGMTKAALLNVTKRRSVSGETARVVRLLLIDRDRRGFRLTPSGERLLVRAQRLLSINDEIWSTMTAPQFAGEVRLGVPSDIVRTYLPALLRQFNAAWPQVRVTLVCDSSERLIAGVNSGDIDLAITTELGCGVQGETLLVVPLVWVGAEGGKAWELDPLPIATGDTRCPFRTVALKTLADAGRDWISTCEVSSFEPICANVEADLAVAPLLASTVPVGLEVVGQYAGLPPLPDFSVNLYVSRIGAKDAAVELASHIRLQLGTKHADVLEQANRIS
jgi:DNA-binding transcriptional LysR family regulator